MATGGNISPKKADTLCYFFVFFVLLFLLFSCLVSHLLIYREKNLLTFSFFFFSLAQTKAKGSKVDRKLETLPQYMLHGVFILPSYC